VRAELRLGVWGAGAGMEATRGQVGHADRRTQDTVMTFFVVVLRAGRHGTFWGTPGRLCTGQADFGAV